MQSETYRIVLVCLCFCIVFILGSISSTLNLKKASSKKMSLKKTHTAAFYLLDANDYKTFTQLKDENIKLQKQIAELMKYRDLHSSALQNHFETKLNELHNKLKNRNIGEVTTETLEAHGNKEPSLQTGAGSNLQLPDFTSGADCVDSDVFIQKKLLSAFENFMESHKKSNCQIGGGDDTTPLLALPLQETNSVPSDIDQTNASSLVPDSSENVLSSQSFDVTQLVNAVPPTQLAKAQQLIEGLKNYSSDLLFDSNGQVILNGQILPNTNASTVLSEIYGRPKNNTNILPIVNEIASLGLGHLIPRHFTRGITPRGSNYLKNRADIKRSLNPLHPWYYMHKNE